MIGLMSGAALDREIAKVHKNAIVVGPEVQGLAERIATEYGAVCTPINYKSETSIKRKVLMERETGQTLFSPEQLKDTVRTTIVADRKHIESIIALLQKEKSFLCLKRQDTEMGYTGNIINITTANGTIARFK